MNEYSYKPRYIAPLLFMIAVILLGFATGAAAVSLAGHPTKKALDRDDVYYTIENDAGDFGNFIETYHVPVPGTGRSVFCIVYSDKIGDGGGAGPSCDWVGFWKGR